MFNIHPSNYTEEKNAKAIAAGQNVLTKTIEETASGMIAARAKGRATIDYAAEKKGLSTTANIVTNAELKALLDEREVLTRQVIQDGFDQWLDDFPIGTKPTLAELEYWMKDTPEKLVTAYQASEKRLEKAKIKEAEEKKRVGLSPSQRLNNFLQPPNVLPQWSDPEDPEDLPPTRPGDPENFPENK